jgi:hypothetical protein
VEPLGELRPPEALDLSRQIVPSGLRQEELLHVAARPLITRSSPSKGFCEEPRGPELGPWEICHGTTYGTSADDSHRRRHGHGPLRPPRHFSARRQAAGRPALDVPESRAGYQKLEETLERLQARHPEATFHVRIDCAGQYAVNLERFFRDLPLALEVSVGEPARNAAYRKAHFPKRKSDAGDSLALLRPRNTRPTPRPNRWGLLMRGRVEWKAMEARVRQVRQANRLSRPLRRLPT